MSAYKGKWRRCKGYFIHGKLASGKLWSQQVMEPVPDNEKVNES